MKRWEVGVQMPDGWKVWLGGFESYDQAQHWRMLQYLAGCMANLEIKQSAQ